MILSPVTSRKAKEHDDGNASEEVVIARCPLVFTGGHRGGVATGLLGWLVIDAYFALTGRSGDGVLDALCQDRKSTRLNSSHSAKSRMPSSA